MSYPVRVEGLVNSTKLTATTIHNTYNEIVSLCCHFLATSYKYELSGQFIEKLNIKQIFLLLNTSVNIDAFDVNPGQ